MSTWWGKTMLWLGLGPDEEYEEFAKRPVPSGGPAGNDGPHAGGADDRPSGPVQAIDDMPPPRSEPALTSVRPIREPEPDPEPERAPEQAAPAARSAADSSVRAIPISSAKPHVVLPTSFNEAQEIGDRFKVNQPVIMNLQSVDRDLARRLIDFASGLCYGIGGQMERVAKDVYLLTPADVEISEEERRRLGERGLHDG